MNTIIRHNKQTLKDEKVFLMKSKKKEHNNKTAYWN